jgi:hypothetical protein
MFFYITENLSEKEKRHLDLGHFSIEPTIYRTKRVNSIKIAISQPNLLRYGGFCCFKVESLGGGHIKLFFFNYLLRIEKTEKFVLVLNILE